VLPLFILIPLAGLLLISLALKNSQKQVAWGLALLVALAQTVAVLLPLDFSCAPCEFLKQFGFALGMSDLSRVVLLSVGVVMTVTLLIAQAMVDKARLHSFCSLVLLSIVGMNGMALVQDLFSLYVFLEVVSVGSFIMIAFNKDKAALEGAFKYVILSAVASVLMLGADALLVMAVGGTSYSAVHASLVMNNWMAKIAVGGFVCGLLIKGGLVPFHGWVLGAYAAASAPVSVLLAGIATKVSGIYGLIALSVYVFPQSEQLNQALLLVGAVSIIVGAFAAIGQTDMKRLLAYSSISQMGYIVLGLGAVPAAGALIKDPVTGKVVVALGVVGAVFHMFNHAIFKSLLFVTSSSVEKQTGTTDMTRLGGLDNRMRITSWTGLVAMLSTAGVPPLSGFWSKLMIVVALWQTGHTTYAYIAIALSVVTLGYMLVMQKRVFFGKTAASLAGVKEAGPLFVIPSLALAAVTVGVGLCCPLMFETFLVPVKAIFGGGQ
jgi:multicomponent Na+:H+ antiporter subunit D